MSLRLLLEHRNVEFTFTFTARLSALDEGLVRRVCPRSDSRRQGGAH